MNPDELAAIRERSADPIEEPPADEIMTAVNDRRALLAEVDRLTKQLDAVRAAVEYARHDRHAARFNGLVGDCAGCVADDVRRALGEA